MKLNYSIIIGITAVIVIGIVRVEVLGKQKKYEYKPKEKGSLIAESIELEGRLIQSSRILTVANLYCGERSFQPEGIYDSDYYRKRWDIRGNYITLCSKNFIDYSGFKCYEYPEPGKVKLPDKVKIKGSLYKTDEGQGYLIVNIIEKVQK